jgi:hypothetical protein
LPSPPFRKSFSAVTPRRRRTPNTHPIPASTPRRSALETRIDTLPRVSPSASTGGLAQVFQSAGIDAVLTLSSAQTPTEKDGLWVPIHSAVVLHAVGSANPQALASALQQTLRGSLTAASIGINFQPSDVAGTAIYALTGPRPLFFAISSTPAQGNLVLLTDDQALLSDLLHNLAAGSPEKTTTSATLIAVFNHSSQRAPYLRLTSLIDGTNNQARDPRNAAAIAPNGMVGVASTPTFFSRNLGSLSDAFANLQSERVVERTVDSNLRQTVTYVWQTP